MSAPLRVAVCGDRHPGHDPQDAIEPALSHAAAARGVGVEVTWFDSTRLADGGTGQLSGHHGVWGAPGSPFASLDGALAGIRWARAEGVPFLGTCAGFQHAVIVLARDLLGIAGASHAEYDPDAPDLFISELLCSLRGRTMRVCLHDAGLIEAYGADQVDERYYCSFGLAPDHRGPLEAAGVVVAGTDAADGDVRILRLGGHPFFVATLFVPQVASRPEAPHPIVRAFVAAAEQHAAGG